ncbi:uncharacterized protein K452DRAFT_235979 [Aplosporella prunicola CBS 121167]|uniref:Aminoglycoside phosphotransferase domain-containing protein n=1 Tax=Aplosporella prunicola CBS 121167 TaxID=1176127 RepID=A0A6A6B0H0_9PEZI|nr:uncharacterized protein K452DRAFT_235979 [Aplosporella prunicola CBS 121167]KAF2137376.1 hypothetical protein K452DRAFT_235979 [Aplosporella prunicola CBS 121167]
MDSAPINNSWIWQYAVLVLIALLKRFRPRKGNVLMLSGKFCVKYGPHVCLAEASTMRFIAQKTSIPVPKVYCAFKRGDWTYIVMEKISGDMIGQGWVQRSEESKASILFELKRLVQEMRDIPASGPGVHNVDGGPLFDPRLPGPSLRIGPFESIQAFHQHLRGGLHPDPNLDPKVNELIELQDGPWPPPNFTHGDLSSLNILSQEDKIVGIIDWETAGWFPSYWEYTTACQVNPQNSFWREEIDKFLEPLPKELAMEEIRQRFFGDF